MNVAISYQNCHNYVSQNNSILVRGAQRKNSGVELGPFYVSATSLSVAIKSFYSYASFINSIVYFSTFTIKHKERNISIQKFNISRSYHTINTAGSISRQALLYSLHILFSSQFENTIIQTLFNLFLLFYIINTTFEDSLPAATHIAYSQEIFNYHYDQVRIYGLVSESSYQWYIIFHNCMPALNCPSPTTNQT